MKQRSIAYFDWINFFLMIALMGTGLLCIFSATSMPEQMLSLFFCKQSFGCVLGLGCYFFFALLPIDKLIRWGAVLYTVVLFFLAYTIVAGWIGMGAKRWVNFYFFRAQPSEAAKMFCPIFLGYYFDELARRAYDQQVYERFAFYLFPLLVIGLSTLLIIKQPDLGTGLLVLIGSLVALWCIGLSKKFFICLIFGCFMGSPILWHSLKNYQKTRILVLLGYGDIKKERYQVEQSKIAIGSGGLWGKGFLKGTQNQFDFLPEDHTDFIFSILCEEWGFIGAFFVLLLFILLVTRILWRITLIASPAEKLIACGLVSHILLSVCINVGMVSGIVPVVGIPLPLMSYGLSNLWITMSTLGWLNNSTGIIVVSK